MTYLDFNVRCFDITKALRVEGSGSEGLGDDEDYSGDEYNEEYEENEDEDDYKDDQEENEEKPEGKFYPKNA